MLETAEGKEPTAAQRKQATQEIQTFLTQLRQVKILDPACGTGNFLYVTLDLLKGLEQVKFHNLSTDFFKLFPNLR